MRPRPTATLRMRERCSNSANLAGFRNQLVLELFVSVLEMSQTQQESDRQKRRYFPQTNDGNDNYYNNFAYIIIRYSLWHTPMHICTQ